MGLCVRTIPDWPSHPDLRAGPSLWLAGSLVLASSNHCYRWPLYRWLSDGGLGDGGLEFGLRGVPLIYLDVFNKFHWAH